MKQNWDSIEVRIFRNEHCVLVLSDQHWESSLMQRTIYSNADSTSVKSNYSPTTFLRRYEVSLTCYVCILKDIHLSMCKIFQIINTHYIGVPG